MKIRNDSAFAKLTEDQRDYLVGMSHNVTLDRLVEIVAQWSEPIVCSSTAMSRYLKKAKQEKMLSEAEASEEAMEAFAKRGSSAKVREATLGAMRERMYEVAIDSNNRDLLMDVFGALNEEKAKERGLELEERKIKVAEENARLGWRKLELENARSALKLLPKLRELASDVTKPAEERLALVLSCLEVDGGRLLTATTATAAGTGAEC